MCDPKKGQQMIQFKVGMNYYPLWERMWRRIFQREQGVNKVPRAWSNLELRKIGSLLSGSILNLSGWCDEDKQGGFYRDYFPHATDYHVSMRDLCVFEGEDARITRRPDVAIDLECPMDSSLVGRYDIVLCHTVLEHVFDIFAAFNNLADLSRDIVIIVVPWCQRVHERVASSDSYRDYWRIAPSAVQRLFQSNGFSLIYINGNSDFHASTYYVAVGSKAPRSHEDLMRLSPSRIPGGTNIYW